MLEDLKERIQLEAILAVLGGAVAIASRTNREIADYVKQKDGIAEIRTEDRRTGMRFYISNGKVRVGRGTHPSPDYAMVYKDIPTAVAVLKQGTQEASMKAISQGELRFEGDFTFGMWFNDLLQNVGKLIRNPRRMISL